MNTEEKILDELLKDTYTLEAFRQRYFVLKKIIEGELYGKGAEVAKATKGAEESGESDESEGEAGEVTRAVGEATEVTKGPEVTDDESQGSVEGLFGIDMELVKEVTSGDYARLNEYVEDFMRGTQALSIYFVFVPEDAQIKEIGGWLRTNLKNPRLLFQVKVDPALIGGCAIAYKGVFKDYSLRARISDNKSKLIEEFRRYFRQ